jgi:hypothetical protein
MHDIFIPFLTDTQYFKVTEGMKAVRENLSDWIRWGGIGARRSAKCENVQREVKDIDAKHSAQCGF